MATVSKFDDETGVLARNHINDFIKKIANGLKSEKGRLLEIGPQENFGDVPVP